MTVTIEDITRMAIQRQIAAEFPIRPNPLLIHLMKSQPAPIRAPLWRRWAERTRCALIELLGGTP